MIQSNVLDEADHCVVISVADCNPTIRCEIAWILVGLGSRVSAFVLENSKWDGEVRAFPILIDLATSTTAIAGLRALGYTVKRVW